MLKKAEALVKAGDLEGALDYGSELNDEVKAGLVELERVKCFVREEAIKRNKAGEDSPVKLQHGYGTTSVSIPEKKWKGKKGKELIKLEEELPEAVFDSLFETERVAVMRDDFEKQLKKLSAEDREKVKRYMEHVADQPRVTFAGMPARHTVIAKADAAPESGSQPTETPASV